MQPIYINQHKVIFYKKNTPLIASLAGSAPSMPLSDPDFFILQGLAVTQSEQLDLTDILPAQVKQAFPQLKTDNIANRIRQYQETQVVLNQPCESPPEIKPISLPELEEADKQTDTSAQYSLSSHFGVNITASGFSLWSPSQHQFLSLSPTDLCLLIGFGNGQAISTVIQNKQYLGLSQTEMPQQYRSAKKAGCLIEKKQLIEQEDTQYRLFNIDQTGDKEVVSKWQELQPNGLIPVYFVPHMENHFPLALGVLHSAIAHFDNGALLEKFQLIPLNYLEPNDLFNGPYRKFGTGIWLFSNYMWSIDINMQISEAVKQHNPGNITIHGGPSTPDYEQACADFLKQYPSVEIAVHGEGEVTITEVLQCIAKNAKSKIEIDSFNMAKVPGITFKERLSQQNIRTVARERMRDPDVVPSPYLSGLFDNYNGRVEAAIIETNRGCPYGCTFCDWGSATNQKIRKFDLQRVKDEITWIGKNQVKVMWIADANYGLYDRDIEISQFIVDTKKKYGYPQEIVVNYTKNSTWRLVEIIKIFTQGGIIGQGIISIQTTDEKTLEVINRKNIRTQRYDELAQAFMDLDLPLSTDLMIGLPGMTVESFKHDLQYYIDMDISVKAYPTQLLPNSPMAEPGYMSKYQIKADENSFLTSTYSYTLEDRHKMEALYQVYVMADGYSLLRYVMRYLQWDHQVQATDFISDLLEYSHKSPDTFPLLTWAVRFFNNDKSMPSGWENFYQQVLSFITEQYQISPNSALLTAIAVNKASMPDDNLSYPFTLSLQHDFSQYFQQNGQVRAPLSDFGGASMVFEDPNKLSLVDLDNVQYDTHQYFWELKSDISRPKSLASFVANAD